MLEKLNPLIRYFDLQSEHRTPLPQGNDAASGSTPVVPQYLVVSAGVIVEPLLRQYLATNAWQLDWSFLLGRSIFGLIVGIILLPGIYRSAFDPQKPLLVQLAALFPLGIGWQSLFTSATKLTIG
jgi:hypothetical protein